MPVPVPGRVADIVRQSTVKVRTDARNQSESTGSGVVLTAGQVITNAHVMRGHTIQIESWEGATVEAKLLKLDKIRDLALLSVPGLRSAPLPLADSDALRVGTPVLAVGHPLGFAGAVSSGVVHSTVRRWICADVRLAPGNSGGPLADFEGRVLGINTMVAAGGLAFAVPSRAVQRFLANAPHQELGVVIRPITFRPDEFGLLVLALVPGSIAEQASLMPGDMLVGANGKRFHDADDLSEAIDRAAGGVLHLDFHRGNLRIARQVALNLKGQQRTAA